MVEGRKNTQTNLKGQVDMSQESGVQDKTPQRERKQHSHTKTQDGTGSHSKVLVTLPGRTGGGLKSTEDTGPDDSS